MGKAWLMVAACAMAAGTRGSARAGRAYEGQLALRMRQASAGSAEGSVVEPYAGEPARSESVCEIRCSPTI